MCMYATDIRRESYHGNVCYGYHLGELSCVCMLRISGRRAIVCMYVTDIRRESCNVYVCYGYQER